MGVDGEIRLGLFLAVHARSLYARGSRFMFVYARKVFAEGCRRSCQHVTGK